MASFFAFPFDLNALKTGQEKKYASSFNRSSKETLYFSKKPQG